MAKKFLPNRLSEFAVGRHCARKALMAAGFEQTPLLIANNGAPIWPQNCVGSIAHTKAFTAAAIASAEVARSIGIDVEEIINFPMDIRGDILRADEIVGYRAYDLYPEEIKLPLFFSIKESVYKAYNPIYHQFLEFQDVKLKLNQSKQSYLAYVHQPLSNDGAIQKTILIEGSFLVDSKRVYSSAWVNAEE